ncbi:hypothetical protein SLINC_7030 [Streptomyces lincolnensis]|uniref:Uncharacterized protein n=1 Tax=Streptomyces lincolnensis TaxID=1915 RepID=A0A1B1ML07_STRLN|nr:hypothetical protein [Streptomyces lincolnensis]ANS69254.1 hypothetical protein SLINC_7030 [Streptomyces lincolnensis]AXG58173.1 hypothetical protein SLCG_7018 [Streptomyces lincolnensis]QMV10838.1 hypothetical protein GJU35_37615 [Streptomyces lincolnensis]
MGLSFHRNPDGSTTGRNQDTNFTVTDTDEEEVKRRLYEDAGWEYTPPPPPVPAGFHRFALVDDAFDGVGFGGARYASLREDPPVGCVPVDWGRLALKCERPGATLWDAIADTVSEVRCEHGVVMNSLGIEKADEWFDARKDGYGAEIAAQLLLMAAQRAALLGYGRQDLIRLLEATGIE